MSDNDNERLARMSPVGKAIAEDEFNIATIRSETRKRRMWALVRVDILVAWAQGSSDESVQSLLATCEENGDLSPLARLWAAQSNCERPEDAEVRLNENMYAVWMGKDQVPMVDPQW